MKKVMKAIWVVATVALLAGQVSAEVINVNWAIDNQWAAEGWNIMSNAPGQGVLADSGTAGVWNNFDGNTSPTNLTDSAGNVTSVGVDMGSAAQYWNNSELTPVNNYIYTANTNTFTFSGLDVGQEYEVAFLGHGNNDNPTILTMGGVTKTTAPNPFDTTQTDWVVGENYNTFTFTADASGEATGTWTGDGTNAGSIGALQLAVIPEPATLGLFVTLGGALFFLRRHGRRFME